MGKVWVETKQHFSRYRVPQKFSMWFGLGDMQLEIVGHSRVVVKSHGHTVCGPSAMAYRIRTDGGRWLSYSVGVENGGTRGQLVIDQSKVFKLHSQLTGVVGQPVSCIICTDGVEVSWPGARPYSLCLCIDCTYSALL